MGILYSNAEFLLESKAKGVKFDNVLTIGHLKLFITKNKLELLKEKFNLKLETSQLKDFCYCNDFFKLFLETKNISSLDYSDYEKCDIVHDMNKLIDTRYHEQFDVVIDGGSLEHIFNFPTAIKNCMSLVKEGGSFFSFTMANNHLGHGFYQFCPELFYRIFNKENGYLVQSLLLEQHKYPGAELNQNTKVYHVKDPNEVNQRVGLVSRTPVMMMIHATRISIENIFNKYPIQSDYISTYETHKKTKEESKQHKTKSFLKKCFYTFPVNIRNAILGTIQLRKYSFKNKIFYTRKKK